MVDARVLGCCNPSHRGHRLRGSNNKVLGLGTDDLRSGCFDCYNCPVVDFVAAPVVELLVEMVLAVDENGFDCVVVDD